MPDEQAKQGLTTRIAVIAPSDGINDDEYNNYLPEGRGCHTALGRATKTLAYDKPISVGMVASYGDLNAIAHFSTDDAHHAPTCVYLLLQLVQFCPRPDG